MNFHQKQITFVTFVSLTVSDLERSLDYYENIIGFQTIEKSAREAVLAVDGKTPLVKLEQPDDPIPKGAHQPGLYHFAILLPTRADLGSFLKHIIEKNVRIGASDHIVSEAIYLSDPDGNGIEVYADRPASVWQAESGTIRMSTDPLDAASLLAEAEKPWEGMPAETVMGHIHLHVVDLKTTEQFYCKGLGFDVVFHYPQALFMSTGGYHHHIAANTWNHAREMNAKPLNQVGLQWFSVVFPSEEAREEAINNLQALGYSVEPAGNGFRTNDPSGNELRLQV